jgi:hypothetical protein
MREVISVARRVGVTLEYGLVDILMERIQGMPGIESSMQVDAGCNPRDTDENGEGVWNGCTDAGDDLCIVCCGGSEDKTGTWWFESIDRVRGGSRAASV